MGSLYPSHLLSASSHFHTSPRVALKVEGLKEPFWYLKAPNFHRCIKTSQVLNNTRLNITCAMNMAAGQSGDPEKTRLDDLMGNARELWDGAPQPVKSFPWNRVLDNFIQLILDLFVSVVKYLSVPLLTVTSLSEMSYCAHQKKLLLVPFPFLIGFLIAWVLNETALELSPTLKEAEVPWHLIAIAIFFSMIKLPGPYYPFWGRIFIPHVANGALWSSLWFALVWPRRQRKASEDELQQN